MSTPKRTFSPSRPARGLTSLAGVAGLLAVAVLSGCGTDDGSGTDETGSDQPASTGELASRGGEVCPGELPLGDDPGAEALGQPAESAPELPAATQAWVCRYDYAEPGQDSETAGPIWVRAGEASEVDEARLAEIDRDLAELAPAEEDRACTADMGPRWMLVVAAEDDLTGVVVDDFGCRDVRLTSEPFDAVAGLDEQQGVVPGVLTAPASLLDLVRAHAPDGTPAAGPRNGESEKRWAAMMDRLDCPGPGTIFMHDMSEPPADGTISDAVKGWERPDGELTVDERGDDWATASVVVDGRTVVVLALTRWDNGGWAVEGGADC